MFEIIKGFFNGSKFRSFKKEVLASIRYRQRANRQTLHAGRCSSNSSTRIGLVRFFIGKNSCRKQFFNFLSSLSLSFLAHGFSNYFNIGLVKVIFISKGLRHGW